MILFVLLGLIVIATVIFRIVWENRRESIVDDDEYGDD